MYDVIIVGAGTAGLTAGIYALRAGKRVLILEGKTYGGQIVKAGIIENYPGIPNVSGYDFATALFNQAKDLGAEIKFETVIRVEKDKTVITTKDTYSAKAIILATGAENRKLKIENEEKLVGKGISYCATCDGNFYKNKVVAVVGGGNSALEYAVYLADIASKVYIIHMLDTFQGDNKYVEDLKTKSNVEYMFNTNVIRINGDRRLQSVDIKNNDKETNLEIDGLFIAIGQEPKNEMFSNIVTLNEAGYIVSSDGVHTKTEGIYVAGDAREKELRQLTTATSDGSIAATIAIKEMK